MTLHKFKPFFSIITVVYNGIESIEETIKSVINQPNLNFEYLIIDGGSKDGTLEVIKKYSQNISYWISEKDEGIYDAMNKGIAKATGDYVYFINCGDYLLELPNSSFFKDNKSHLFCFPIKQSDNTNRYPSLGLKLFIRNTLPHQGCFYKNDEQLKYNTKYKVFSDFALNQKYRKLRLKITTSKCPFIAYHSLDGISNNKNSSDEIFQVVNDNFGVLMKYISYTYFRLRGLIYRIKKIFSLIKK